MCWLALVAVAVSVGACRGAESDFDYLPPPPPDFSGGLTGTVPDFSGRVPRNVLVISVDTLRRDHVSFHDPSHVQTPIIDARMETGWVADTHRTCSNWTFHGMSCSLLGTDPVNLGFMPRLGEQTRVPWPADQRSLATEFRDAGFATVLASGNGWLSPTWGSAQGYDTFYGDAFDPAEGLAFRAQAAVAEALTSGSADRWLMHLHFIEPHAAYAPPLSFYSETLRLDPVPTDLDLNLKNQHYSATLDVWPTLSEADQALLETHLRLRYAGEVAWLDHKLARILADLSAAGMLSDTLIVFFTDHGEQFWEHGHQSHAYTLHGEENDGVWFMWAPNIVPARHALATGQIDILPTLLQLYDLPVPNSITGVPVSEVSADRALHALTVARLGGAQSVMRDGWKLTYGWGGGAKLYDRSVDPHELQDLYDPNHPVVQELWPLIVDRLSAAADLAPDQSPRPPPGLQLP